MQPCVHSVTLGFNHKVKKFIINYHFQAYYTCNNKNVRLALGQKLCFCFLCLQCSVTPHLWCRTAPLESGEIRKIISPSLTPPTGYLLPITVHELKNAVVWKRQYSYKLVQDWYETVWLKSCPSVCVLYKHLLSCKWFCWLISCSAAHLFPRFTVILWDPCIPLFCWSCDLWTASGTDNKKGRTNASCKWEVSVFAGSPVSSNFLALLYL